MFVSADAAVQERQNGMLEYDRWGHKTQMFFFKLGYLSEESPLCSFFGRN